MFPDVPPEFELPPVAPPVPSVPASVFVEELLSVSVSVFVFVSVLSVESESRTRIQTRIRTAEMDNVSKENYLIFNSYSCFRKC